MPPRPQSPQQTNTAPLLPKPATFDTVELHFCKQKGHTKEKEEDKLCKEPRGFCNENRQQPMTTFNKTLHSPHGQASSFSSFRPALKTLCAHAVREEEEERRPAKDTPKTTATTTNCTNSGSGVVTLKDKEKEKKNNEKSEANTNNINPPPAASPTAYEAALAKYGKKLLSITQRQIYAKGQRRHELLRRHRAVNEKYSELSRAAKTTKKKSTAPREEFVSTLSRRAAVDDSAHEPAKKTELNAALVHNETLKRPSSPAGGEVGHLGRMSTAVIETADVLPLEEKKKNKKNNYCQLNSGDCESVTSKTFVKDGDAKVVLCVDKTCDAASAHSSKEEKKNGNFVHLNHLSFFNSNTTSPMLSCSNFVDDKKKNLLFPLEADMFDYVRFLAPSYFTPPRPLWRTCSPRLCSYSPRVKEEKKIFFSGPKKETVVDMFCNHHLGYEVGACCEETGRTTRRGFAFIRPQQKPRPLHCRWESASLSSGRLCGKEEADFFSCGPLAGRFNEQERSNNLGLFFSSSNRNRKKDCEKQRQQQRQVFFTSVVPTHILDEFAQLRLMRLVWRRWQSRFWQKKLLRLRHAKYAATTDADDNASRLAALKTWASEVVLPAPLLL